jgi:hypothetical protein
MNVGCMITNGGPHPPEKWASVTAQKIIDISANAPDALYREARAFQAKIEELLVGHHRLAQEHERAALATAGTTRLVADIDTSGHVPDALDDVLAAARGTSFAAHFAVPRVQQYVERVLHEHTHDIMYLERSCHADVHPDHPSAKAFKTVQNEGHQALMLTDDELTAIGGREAVLAMVMVRNSAASMPKPETAPKPEVPKAAPPPAPKKEG